MNIYNDIYQIPKQNRIIVLGNFDGVHQGHRQLLACGKALASQHKMELMVLTFYPQLQEIFHEEFRYLLSQRVKMHILEVLGIDTVLALPFNEDIAKMSPEAFVKEILLQSLGAQFVVVGFNYTFGYRGAGTAENLKSLTASAGVETVVVEPVYVDKELVSSTAIRTMLQEGRLEKVNEFLGYPFMLDGTVVHGHHVGRTMGIPTANLQVDSKVALPMRGVYAVEVWLTGRHFLGVLNVGMRPTVDNGTDTSVEVHILDFDEDIYGEYVLVSIHHYLRGETKFDSLEQLKEQIARDMDKTRALLAKIN